MAEQSQQKIVVGIFADRAAVVPALKELKMAGFRDDQLGFTLRQEEMQHIDEHIENRRREALARGIMGGVLGVVDLLLVPIMGPAGAGLALESALPAAEGILEQFPQRKRQTTPLGPAQAGPGHPQRRQKQEGDQRTGAVTGGVLGGILGAAVALLLPGIGTAIAAGILAGALSGAALGGVAGGFFGAFVEMGIPESRARFYEQEFKAGRTIMTIKADDNAQEQQARSILHQHGAQNVEAH